MDHRLIEIVALLGVGIGLWVPAAAAEAQKSPAAVVSTAGHKAPPAPSRWWALLISAEQYDRQTSGLEPLAYCFEDMAALRNEWLIAAGVPAEQIVHLNDRAPDRRPTKANIERQLANITSQLGPGDALMIGAALHGLQLAEGSYLCPIDARVKLAQGKSPLQAENLLALSGVFDQVSKCPAAFKLLVFDACRESVSRPEANASDASAGRRAEFITSLGRMKGNSRGLAVLVSCSEGQSAYELPETRHGAFVHFFLGGLRGNADLYSGNHDGIVSLREAATYANRETKKKIYLQYKLWQEPDLLLGEATMNFPLAVVEQPKGTGAKEDDLAFLERYGNTLLRWSMSSQGRIKEYDLSVDLLSQVVRSRPENREAYARRGVAYRAKGDYALAMADFQKAGSELELFVKYEGVPLAVADTKTPPLPPGARVSITQIEGDWLWAAAVDNDPSRRLQGWIYKQHVTWDPGLAELVLPATPQRRQSDGAVIRRVLEVANGLPYIPSYIPTSLSVPGISIPSYSLPSLPSVPSIPRPSIPSPPNWRSFVPF